MEQTDMSWMQMWTSLKTCLKRNILQQQIVLATIYKLKMISIMKDYLIGLKIYTIANILKLINKYTSSINV